MNRLARAIEAIFGSSLVHLGRFLQAIAIVTLLAAIAVSLLRAALALRAWRYGWERGILVRCRQCGRLAAEPETPVCPAGHPVRFPAFAARAESLRRRLGPWRRSAQAYPFVLLLALVASAMIGFVVLRVGRLETPLATIAASLGFLFFLALLYAVSQVLAARRDGWFSRAFHAGLAALLLLPVLILSLLARSFEPPERQVLGHFWSTPTSFYLSAGRRARNAGGATARVEAHLIEVRAPAAGILWEGLEGLGVGQTVLPWKGKGGRAARFLGRWAGESSEQGALVREIRTVDVPPNVRILILKKGGAVEFEPEE